MKRVLVTGHTGFIGKALVSFIKSQGLCHIIGVSQDEGVNLCEKNSLSPFHDINVIVHLAGSVGVMSSWERPEAVYENNIVPTLRVLEYSRKNCSSVVYISSYVYGAPRYLPVDEAHVISCTNPYASSKRQAEMLCEAYAKDYGVNVTVLRPFNIYGFGQSDENLVALIIKQALSADCIQVRDLRPRRDYLYIDDFVEAVARVVNSDPDKFDIYNLGYGTSYSVQEVIDLVLKATEKKMPIRCLELQRKNEIMDCCSNSTKFNNKFQWSPKYDLETGIRHLMASMEAKG